MSVIVGASLNSVSVDWVSSAGLQLRWERKSFFLLSFPVPWSQSLSELSPWCIIDWFNTMTTGFIQATDAAGASVLNNFFETQTTTYPGAIRRNDVFAYYQLGLA